MNKDDYKILSILNNNECTNDIKSISIYKISEITGYNLTKVRRSIKTLMLLEYVNEGALQNKKKCYYITLNGINKINEYNE